MFRKRFKKEMKVLVQVRLYRKYGVVCPAIVNGKPVLPSVLLKSPELCEEYRLPFYKKGYRGRNPPFLYRWMIRLYSGKGEKVLDPCFGSGTVFYEGAKLGREVYGVDISKVAVGSFVERWAQYGFGGAKIHYELGDAGRLNFVPDFFDFVIFAPPWFVITKFSGAKGSMEKVSSYGEYLALLAKVLSECYRVLKPGKFICVIQGPCTHKGHRYDVSFETKKLLELCGFENWFEFYCTRRSEGTLKMPFNESAALGNFLKAGKGLGIDMQETVLVWRKR